VRFVRGQGGDNYWRELDDVGREAMVLDQLHAQNATAWLWWMSMVWTAFNKLDANQQAVLGSIAFMASSQQHLIPSVPWPGLWLDLCRALRMPPMTVLLLGVLLCGAAAAAAVPLMSGHVLLRDVQSGRLVKLTDRLVLMKGGEQNRSWRELAHGAWARAPAELTVTRMQRLWHAGFMACLAALAARVAHRLQ
jgi:hypothetical protein